MSLRVYLVPLALLGTLTLLADPKVDSVRVEQLQKLIAARKGKVVLVNFWATWCEPCVEEFPDLVKLYNKHRKLGLELIAVSVDDPYDLNTKVIPFLKEQKVSFTCRILAEDQDMNEFITAFDPKWSGAIPRTYLYDRQGRRVKVWTGAQTFKTFEKAVQPLLQKRLPPNKGRQSNRSA